MKKLISLLAVLLLTGCSGEDNSASTSNETEGTFKATMNGKKIEATIRCFFFDDEKFDTEFLFASDDGFGNKDTDGDGLVIRGDRINLTKPIKMDGIALTVIDNGVEYETAVVSLGKFSKNDKGISGTATLYKTDSTAGSASITYEVVCKK